MQITGGYPDPADYDPHAHKVAELDRQARIWAHQERRVQAMAALKKQLANDLTEQWLERLQDLLGPEPTTGQEWADRGLRLLELAQVEGIGLNAKACAAYAEECNKRAAWLDKKFSPRMSVDVDVTVQALQARLNEGRARVLPNAQVLPSDDNPI